MKLLLAIVITVTIITSTTLAGLDQHGRFDEVIAVYKFENTRDSGPIGYDGSLRDEASIVDNGKIDKCLKIESGGSFLAIDLDKSLSVVSRAFSVVAWVKTTSTTGTIWIDASGIQEGDSNYGSISMFIFPGGGDFGNIVGSLSDDEDDDFYSTGDIAASINDGEWHHFAFSLSEDFYRVFIDGNIMFEEREDEYIGFLGFEGSIIGVFAGTGTDERELNKPAFVDEVAFFETGFSPYEVKGLYQDGLTEFLEIMPVNPQGLLTTTWADIKSNK